MSNVTSQRDGVTIARHSGDRDRPRRRGKGSPRDATHHRRAIDAERERANAATRDYRARLKRGEAIAPTPYNNAIVGLLIDLGWLAVEASEDRREIGSAISRMLAATAARHKNA